MKFSGFRNKYHTMVSAKFISRGIYSPKMVQTKFGQNLLVSSVLVYIFNPSLNMTWSICLILVDVSVVFSFSFKPDMCKSNPKNSWLAPPRKHPSRIFFYEAYPKKTWKIITFSSLNHGQFDAKWRITTEKYSALQLPS